MVIESISFNYIVIFDFCSLIRGELIPTFISYSVEVGILQGDHRSHLNFGDNKTITIT